jgi:outer membrane lipopolysaccharide assembly protein LptE/RlpB
MRFFIYIALFCVLSSCWPTSVSFVDGNMPPEWKFFSIKTLENNAPNAPLSYAALLSEDLKDGVQNNTKLKLNSSPNTGEVQIEGVISNYTVSPIAIQAGDVAAKNRLTVSVNFKIYIKAPKEDEMNLTATRFFDFDSSQDFASVEKQLIEEINKQIVQDLINKLLSNW